MNTLLPSTLQPLLVSNLGWALIHFVWQGTLVGIAAALALMALRNARPQTRYAVCCGALALCSALPIIGVWRGLDVAAAATSTPAPHLAQLIAVSVRSAGTAAATWQSSLQGQLPWIVALWSLGAGLLATRMALGMLWVERMGRSQTGATHPRWQTRVDRLAATFGIRRTIRLRVVEALDTPVVAGWWRPMVLAPAALIANMPFELLEALLAHELAHIKRHDYIVNLIQSAIEALLFYHPVVWWLSRQIRIEREQIADDLAAIALGEPRRLALALQQLDAFQHDQRYPPGRPAGASRLVPAANGGHLMSRIQRLIRPNQHALSWRMALPIIGLTVVCLTVYAHDSAALPGSVAMGTHDAVSAASVAASATPASASVTATSATSAAAATASAAPTIASVMAPSVASMASVASATAAANSTANTSTSTNASSNIVHAHDGDEDGYAIISAGKDGMTLFGDSRDTHAIEAAKRKMHGDFIWVRRGNKAYVVSDPALVAEVTAAMQPVEALGKQMEAMGAQMDVPSKRMQDLGKQMESLSSRDNPANAKMEKASAQMEALGRQQEAIGNKIEVLGSRMEHVKEADRDALERQMQALEDQMKPIEQQMDKLSHSLDERSRDIEAAQQPIEALGKQMEEESKPMEALGKQMDALGKQEELLSKEADRKVRVLIDEAMRNGKVQSVDVLR